jgi:hypothetical protein
VTSDEWFTKLDRLNSVLRWKPGEMDSTYKAVKIAILDTGVCDDFGGLVKCFKDFVYPDNSTYQDNTGHGTNAVRLVAKIYDKAEVYVGRVFDGPHATHEIPALMAESIRHAVKTWKAEIIIMSSGFHSENDELEQAVEEARSNRTLIFAAAANHGNLEHIAFPARLYVDMKLFCMFSTRVKVRAHPEFNPTVNPKAYHNFAILGEDIQLPPNMEQRLSGTSFATMIGGALAARIIDFSRQKDIRKRIRKIDRLHEVGRMSAIFDKMVNNAVDNNYHCIAPWKILEHEGGDRSLPTPRYKQRECVCETISRALAGRFTE